MNNTADLRKKNLLDILKTVWKHPPRISRPEIAQLTGLTNMTATTLMAELCRAGLVVHDGIQPSKGGRKALLYSMNKEAGVVVGINLQLDRAAAELFDLCGGKVKSVSAALSADEDAAQNLEKIIAMTTELLECRKGIKLLGMGVTVPGRVDRDGTVRSLTNMPKWRSVPLKSILEKEFRVPVFVERDTNAHITCLKLSDKAPDAVNMVYIAADEGVGGGVLIDNSVYKGACGIAGEIGHITVNPDGEPCNCGNRGCVEGYASHSAILRAYGVGEKLGRLRERELVLELAARADSDSAADEAFRRAVKYLAACTVNVINMYNPSVIAIECGWMRTAKKYFELLSDEVFASCGFFSRDCVEIIMNPVENIFTASTYTIVLERMLTDIDNNILIG